jgi:hypothetical protein
MVLLSSAPIDCNHQCIATLTLPLALFLLLAETATGGIATVAYLRITGGLTSGFLKFIVVTYAVFGLLALLVAWAGPPSSYHALLGINAFAARALVVLQAVLVIALIVNAVVIWRGSDNAATSWVLVVSASVLLITAIAGAFWPLAGSLLDGAAVALVIILSAAVLGAATTGMLLGHWYLVTPALTNRPLLRAIGLLLIGLVLQAIVFPLALGGLAHGAGAPARALGLSPILSVLWALGAVILPLLAAGLAFPTCRLRAFNPTTGLLYLAMIALLPGQLLGQLLFFVAASS